MAVASEVDKPEVRVTPINDRKRRKRNERLPSFVVGALIEARRRPANADYVELAVTRKVKELDLARGQRDGWGGGDTLDRGEARRDASLTISLYTADGTEIALVEPTVGLLGQNAGESFTIQVHPLIAGAVETIGKILEALRINS